MESFAVEPAAAYLRPVGFVEACKEFMLGIWFNVGLTIREQCWDKDQSARHFKDDDEEKYMTNAQKKQATAPSARHCGW